MAAKPTVVVSCTHGAEAAESVTVAYLTAGAALDAGHEAVMWLTVDAVRLAEAGYADDIQTVDAPPVGELHARFVGGGGRFLVCRTCWSGRDLDESRLVPGATIADASDLIALAGDGALTFSY
jgi:predicted peroxiredoxin